MVVLMDYIRVCFLHIFIVYFNLNILLYILNNFLLVSYAIQSTDCNVATLINYLSLLSLSHEQLP